MTDTQALRQQLIKNLSAMAAGQGGDADVFTPALDKQLAQGITMAMAAPGTTALPAHDQPDSDRPSPASQDE